MNNEIVDYLIEKGNDNETINGVLKYYEEGFLDKLTKIYGILGYFGIADNQINTILKYDPHLVDLPILEITKMGWVLKDTKIIDDLIDNKLALKNVHMYKRIYLRYKAISNSGINYRGLTVLLERENKAYTSCYNLVHAIKEKYNAHISNDSELEEFYNNMFKANGKDITIDEYLKKMAVHSYNDYFLKKEKSKNK